MLRISLILAIVFGLAVGVLNVVMVKDKITKLAADRDNEKNMKVQAQTELASTKSQLRKTTDQLKQTQTELASTKDELSKASAEAASQQKRADTVTIERDKARKERDDAQAELAAYKLTDLKPEQILAIKKQYNDLVKQVEGLMGENKALGRRIVALTNELAIYRTPEYVVPLPPGLHGKVVASDPKWNFVILNVGEEQGVLEQGELLVNRNGKLVAKVKVRSVQKDRSVANVEPGWQIGEVLEGDQVIPANPKSS
ncbi:MAG TPA: hypothetical protein VG146_19830 [Verrucomicrobiae bacterium]|nr:hypothetical protein [Verrucomicrobiae bacterium]